MRAHLAELLDRREDPLAEHRMRLDDRTLLGGQRAGLREDRRRDPDLADVVEQRPELEALELARLEPELARRP